MCSARTRPCGPLLRDEVEVKVPFVDLKRVVSLVQPTILDRWADVVRRRAFVGGEPVARLEAELGRRAGVEHAVCCGSGTDALRVALQALGVEPGQRVALPNLTFWATYEAVVQLGATPVLLDVDPTDLQLDLGELSRGFEQLRFRTAILVHLMGWASRRLEEIRSFCREHEIALLEDAAQAFGVEANARPVLAGAQVSALSFYPAKVLGGCADGGAVLTDDPAVASRVRSLCNHGRSGHFAHERAGWCSRMGGLDAEWLLEMLDRSDHIVATRRSAEARYRSIIGERGVAARPFGPPTGIDGNGYLSVWTVDPALRESVANRLARAGIAVGRVYPATIADQPPARSALRVSELGHGRAFCDRVINLPMFYGLTDEEQGYVCDAFAEALEEHGEAVQPSHGLEAT